MKVFIIDLTKVHSQIHMRDSCNAPLPINTNDVPPIRVYRCDNTSTCIEQLCVVELQMIGDYSVVTVTHRTLVVWIERKTDT